VDSFEGRDRQPKRMLANMILDLHKAGRSCGIAGGAFGKRHRNRRHAHARACQMRWIAE
jgi:hypothetical protein